MKNYLLIAIYLVFTVTALILMKLGGSQLALKINTQALSLNISWLSLLGMVCYMISFLLWITIIPKFNLSYIVPLTVGITQVLTLIAAILIFKEALSAYKLSGIILVIIGIVLLNL